MIFMTEVRDFIYLDQRRVLSYGSQLLGGLTNTITTIEGSTQDKAKQLALSGKAGIDGKVGEKTLALASLLTSLLGKASFDFSGEISPHFSSRQLSQETRHELKLLDHFQFTLLRDALKEQGLLKKLDKKKAHEWTSGKALADVEPGYFVELTSRVKIFDVGHLEAISRSLERFLEMIDQLAIAKRIQRKIHEGIDVEEAFRSLNDNPMRVGYEARKESMGGATDPVELNAMIGFMKDIAEGAFAAVPLHITARPITAPRDGMSFVAPIKEDNLIDSKEELLFKYGHEPGQDWTVLGQICKKPKKTKKIDIKFDTPDLSNMRKINDFIKEITNTLIGISSEMGLQSFVEYPDVSINLIAIYR